MGIAQVQTAISSLARPYRNTPNKALYSGIVEITEGQRLQVRTGTADDITLHLNELCPSSKAWEIRVRIEVIESDA